MDYKKLKNTDAELKLQLKDRNHWMEKRKKLSETGAVYDAWKKVSPSIKRAATEHLNDNLDKAEKLYKNVFLEINSRTSAKRALGETEIKSVLNKKDNLGSFLTRMAVAEQVLDKANEYIEKGTKICNIATGLYAIYIGYKDHKMYKTRLSRVMSLREEMRYGQEQMMHVAEIMAELASFAPPGMREYLEYNISAFLACGKTFDLVNKYARKIEELSVEVFSMLAESLKSSKSLKTGDSLLFDDKYKKMHKKYNVGDQLDIVKRSK